MVVEDVTDDRSRCVSYRGIEGRARAGAAVTGLLSLAGHELFLPELFCPFPPATHPRLERIEQEALERWAERLGLCAGHAGLRKLEKSRLTVLVSRCHPTANEEDMISIVDFIVWLFLWDDQFDRLVDDALASPEWLRQTNEMAARVLRGEDPGDGDRRMLRILADIRARLARRMPAAWMGRFCRHL
ncbi:MAG: hypothetical protein IT372_38185, partial [Polyangiaceae bacterium]|nr:hypothetical protein [Polyangiaceae bacterium]